MARAIMARANDAILMVDDITVRFDTDEGAITAVDGVSFDVKPGAAKPNIDSMPDNVLSVKVGGFAMANSAGIAGLVKNANML